MNWLKKCVILAHRYLGIALSLLIVMWFASGIVMMTGGMPRPRPSCVWTVCRRWTCPVFG
jgi:hypothetical protein